MFFHVLPDLDRFKETFASVYFLRSFPTEPGESDAFICEIRRDFVSFIFRHGKVDVVFKLPTDRFEERFYVIVNGAFQNEKRYYSDQPDVGKAIDTFIANCLMPDYYGLSFILRAYVNENKTKEVTDPIVKLLENLPITPVEPVVEQGIKLPFLTPRRHRALRTIDEIIDKT